MPADSKLLFYNGSDPTFTIRRLFKNSEDWIEPYIGNDTIDVLRL